MQTNFEHMRGTTIRKHAEHRTVIINDVGRDMRLAQDEGIYNVEINRVFNADAIKDIDFLKDYDFVEGVTIVSDHTFNLNPLLHLPRLKSIVLACRTIGKIDFSSFKQLSYFGLEKYSKDFSTLFENQSLQKINLGYYQQSDFQEFERLNNLKEITLTNSSVCSTDGLERLKKLEGLRLYINRKMKFMEFSETCPLGLICLGSFTRLEGFKGFSNLPNLKTLQLQNCPRLVSIKELSACPSLQALALFDRTKIEDCDVSILKRMKKTWLQEFKHYNLKKIDLTTITSELAYL